MSQTVTYHFSLISPWAYLGHARFMDIAAEAGAEVEFRPLDMPTVFKETGGLPLPKRHPSVQRYRLTELERWSRRLNVPITLQPTHFPTPTVLASATVLSANDIKGADVGRLVGALLAAVWAEERDIADPLTLVAIVDACGLDGGAVVARADTDEMKARAIEVTNQSLAEGVFGSPTYVVEGEPFWGQDRLFMVEERLAATSS